MLQREWHGRPRTHNKRGSLVAIQTAAYYISRGLVYRPVHVDQYASAGGCS
eukprot:COSAG01_NODE_69381_length_261_cov_1.179012_1_plen_50_part_01